MFNCGPASSHGVAMPEDSNPHVSGEGALNGVPWPKSAKGRPPPRDPMLAKPHLKSSPARTFFHASAGKSNGLEQAFAEPEIARLTLL